MLSGSCRRTRLKYLLMSLYLAEAAGAIAPPLPENVPRACN